MKRMVCAGIFLLMLNCCAAQHREYAFYELYQLDSLSQASSPGRHFGGLYFDFLTLVEKKLEGADPDTRRLVRNFEQVFARFYIDACIAFSQKREIPLPAWREYFRDTTLSRAQYFLLGANAHLNGGLAEAIANSYTPAEWKGLKKEYVLFNSCLNETLRKVYDEAISTSGRAKTLSFITLGLTRPVSNLYMYKWRKRQMRVTEYYFDKDERFARLQKKIDRKKARIDQMIIRNIR